MAKKLPPVHPGEILREEFLVPLKLTPYAVAAVLNVRRSSLVWRGRKGVHVEMSWQRRNAQVSHGQAIVRRGEPVQFQWWVRMSGRNRCGRARYGGAAGV